MALTLAILTAVGSLLALLLKVWPTQTEQSDDKLDDEKKKQDALIRDWINNGNKP